MVGFLFKDTVPANELTIDSSAVVRREKQNTLITVHIVMYDTVTSTAPDLMFIRP